MTIYHYAVMEKPEKEHTVVSLDKIDMENVDYKRQPDKDFVSQQVIESGGITCGIVRGGMFGLATNQVWVLSAWDSLAGILGYTQKIEGKSGYRITDQGNLTATVRPGRIAEINRDGIYVIRWIRIRSRDIDEYTGLCLETWPAFEEQSQARCYGVFRPLEEDEISTILMLTWYSTLNDWENSRQFDPSDLPKWARRSEMELSHWADAGRLA